MEAWDQWRALARGSERAARLAEAGECPRSAASRYYYAAYQAATALLLYRGLTPPAGREAWNHADTPALLQDQMQPLMRSRDKRGDISRRLADLYRLRVAADYEASELVGAGRVQAAGRDARFVLRVAGDILPER